MRQIILKLLFIPAFLTMVFAVAFAPDTVTAQGLVPCSGSECNFCHFVTLANNVIAWLIGILALVFGVMVFIAGFGLVTSGGNDSKLTDAKKSLTNALIGLIIVLAAWLIVDTLIKLTLPDGETDIGPWNEISCEGGQVPGGDRAPTGAARTQVCTIRLSAGLDTPAGCTCVVDNTTDWRAPSMDCTCRSTLGPGVEPANGCTVETTPPVPGGGPVAGVSGDGVCAVTPLTPLTDAVALDMEGGDTVQFNNPTLQACANRLVSRIGGSITSAYRPQQYQTHFREIHTKWCPNGQNLQNNTDTDCAALKSEVGAEMSRHGLNCAWPVASASNHSTGNAVDISPGGVNAPADTCLTWFGTRDRVHYTLQAGCTCN